MKQNPSISDLSHQLVAHIYSNNKLIKDEHHDNVGIDYSTKSSSFFLQCGVCEWKGTIIVDVQDFENNTDVWKNAKQEYDEHIGSIQ